MFMIDLGAESFYSTLGISPEATPSEVRMAHNRVTGEIERQRQRARTPEEKRALEERLRELNAIGDCLSKPEGRAKYDAENAHLTFFVIRPVAAPAFGQRDIRLRWVHRVMRDFVLQKGGALDPLTDLERTDFAADFTPNDLLDGLMKGRRTD
jgi:hypothetical protein